MIYDKSKSISQNVQKHRRPLKINFLAHVFLGNGEPSAIVGQLCGDFVRGKALAGFSVSVQDAIRHHRAVDSYTDKHPTNLAARRLFEAPHRRYAGIVVDVAYDHFLALDWEHYCDTPLDAYVELVHESLNSHHHMLPDSLKRFAPILKAEKILQNNRHRSHIDLTLKRLSQRRESMQPLASAAPLLWRHEAELKRSFDTFFPQLIAYSNSQRAAEEEM